MELSEIRKMKFGEDFNECPVHGVMMMKFVEHSDGKRTWECPECLAEKERREKLLERKKDKGNFIAFCNKCNVPEEFWFKKFEDYEAATETQKQALSDCRLIATGESDRSVLMLGPNGIGKSMLASLAVIARGGYYYTMYEIATMIKQSYTVKAEESELQIVKRLAQCPVLVIDEMNRSYGSKAENVWLSYIIDKRHSKGLPTIICGNLHKMRSCKNGGCDECVEHYLGSDVCSRLFQDADIIEMKGEDWRRAHRKCVTTT